MYIHPSLHGKITLFWNIFQRGLTDSLSLGSLSWPLFAKCISLTEIVVLLRFASSNQPISHSAWNRFTYFDPGSCDALTNSLAVSHEPNEVMSFSDILLYIVVCYVESWIATLNTLWTDRDGMFWVLIDHKLDLGLWPQLTMVLEKLHAQDNELSRAGSEVMQLGEKLEST